MDPNSKQGSNFRRFSIMQPNTSSMRKAGTYMIPKMAAPEKSHPNFNKFATFIPGHETSESLKPPSIFFDNKTTYDKRLSMVTHGGMIFGTTKS